MVSKKIADRVVSMYAKGLPLEDIASSVGMAISDVMDIVNTYDEEFGNAENDIENGENEEDDEEKPAKKKGNAGKKKTIDEKMDTGAETSITTEVVNKTKRTALDIQKAKEEIGDYVISLFENSGIPVDDIAGFTEYAINFFIENKDKIDTLEKELDTAEGIIQDLYDIADEKAQKERIIKEYVLQCASEGTAVDDNFIQKMLS